MYLILVKKLQVVKLAVISLLFFFFFFFRATDVAYGSSQARDRIRPTAASLHYSSQVIPDP